MGSLIVMIMIGPVGVIGDSIITLVGISLKCELNFSLVDPENISCAILRKDIRLCLMLSAKRQTATSLFISVLQESLQSVSTPADLIFQI